MVTEGPLKGTTIPLAASPILLGRAQEATLVLEDDYASGRHARLFPQGSRWFIEDLGSTNGTYLADQQLTRALPGGAWRPRENRQDGHRIEAIAVAAPEIPADKGPAPKRPLIMRYAARSDVGRIRAKNDDSAYVGRHLAVVADGMGGHAGGDVASAATVLDMLHLDHGRLQRRRRHRAGR